IAADVLGQARLRRRTRGSEPCLRCAPIPTGAAAYLGAERPGCAGTGDVVAGGSRAGQRRSSGALALVFRRHLDLVSASRRHAIGAGFRWRVVGDEGSGAYAPPPCGRSRWAVIRRCWRAGLLPALPGACGALYWLLVSARHANSDRRRRPVGAAAAALVA